LCLKKGWARRWVQQLRAALRGELALAGRWQQAPNWSWWLLPAQRESELQGLRDWEF